MELFSEFLTQVEVYYFHQGHFYVNEVLDEIPEPKFRTPQNHTINPPTIYKFYTLLGV